MNIKISKIAHKCAACENDFTHEQPLTSAVNVLEGALIREDFCADCWDTQREKRAYSVWKTIYFDPKVEEEQPSEVFSPLRQLFYEAAEQESRIEMAKAFLAAGLLRRQKVFRRIKESDDTDGDVRITLYTDRIGNRLIEVPDPQFTYAEMDQARTLLLKRLEELEAAEKASEEDLSADNTGVTDAEKQSDSEDQAAEENDVIHDEESGSDTEVKSDEELDSLAEAATPVDGDAAEQDEEALHAQA